MRWLVEIQLVDVRVTVWKVAAEAHRPAAPSKSGAAGSEVFGRPRGPGGASRQAVT